MNLMEPKLSHPPNGEGVATATEADDEDEGLEEESLFSPTILATGMRSYQSLSLLLIMLFNDVGDDLSSPIT